MAVRSDAHNDVPSSANDDHDYDPAQMTSRQLRAYQLHSKGLTPAEIAKKMGVGLAGAHYLLKAGKKNHKRR
jgi:DNA-binding CsgD family transcriptional regulator